KRTNLRGKPIDDDGNPEEEEDEEEGDGKGNDEGEDDRSDEGTDQSNSKALDGECALLFFKDFSPFKKQRMEIRSRTLKSGLQSVLTLSFAHMTPCSIGTLLDENDSHGKKKIELEETIERNNLQIAQNLLELWRLKKIKEPQLTPLQFKK